MSGQRELTRSRKVDALHNETITRERVDMLERLVGVNIDSWRAHEAVLGRGVFGRLKWLFLGR